MYTYIEGQTYSLAATSIKNLTTFHVGELIYVLHGKLLHI